MLSFRHWLSPVSSPRAGVRFHPSLHVLDDRLTPALNFAPAQALVAGSNPSSTAVGDINQDGRADLVVTNTGSNTVSVLLNTSPGSAFVQFAASQSFAVGNGPVAVAVADVTGDGRPDVVVANATDSTVSVLANTTEIGAAVPAFAAPATFAVNAGTKWIAVADFNGDGLPDIATASSTSVLNPIALGQYTSSNATVSILRNVGGSGSAAFAANQNVYGASSYLTSHSGMTFSATVIPAVRLAVADFDGDGRADLPVTGVISYGTGIPDSTFARNILNTTPAGATSFSFANAPTTGGGNAVAVGDFNGDGVAEGRPLSIDSTAGDFDGDGRADLALVTSDSKVDVRPNTTAATATSASFGASQLFSVGASPVALTAVDLTGDGRLDIVTVGSSGVSVLANTSTDAAVTGPSLVAQFGTTGVWRYNRASGAWDQLTASNATSLATAANGNVIAAFGSAGVWYYRPAFGWSQLNPNAANTVAIDALGNAAASFPGFGLSLYRLSNGGAFSAPLTSVTADQLAMNANGDLVASFAGYGVWKLTQGNWKQLSGASATALAIAANGDVAAVFAGYGVNLYRESVGWTRINGVDATALSIDGSGAVVANFPGYGVAKYIRYANGWQTIAPAVQAAGIATDWGGHVFAAFNGYGVWEYSNAYGWQQRRGNTASTFAVG